MCETEVSCPCSKSQPGVLGQFKGPSGTFGSYCNISCSLLIYKMNSFSDIQLSDVSSLCFLSLSNE